MVAAREGGWEVVMRGFLASLLPPHHYEAQTEPEGFPDAPEDAEGRAQIETQLEAQGQEDVAALLHPHGRGDEKPQGREQHGQGIQADGHTPADGVAQEPENQIDLHRMEQPAEEKQGKGQQGPGRILPVKLGHGGIHVLQKAFLILEKVGDQAASGEEAEAAAAGFPALDDDENDADGRQAQSRQA